MAMGEGEGEGSLRSPEKLKLLYIIKGLTAPGRAGVNYDITSPHGPQETFSKIYILHHCFGAEFVLLWVFMGPMLTLALKRNATWFRWMLGTP